MNIKKFETELIEFDKIVVLVDESVELMESCINDEILKPIDKMVRMYRQWAKKHIVFLIEEHLKPRQDCPQCEWNRKMNKCNFCPECGKGLK